MKERELQNKMGKWFSQWFDVLHEVRSVDASSRIDLILRHKDHPWFVIGVEIKNHDTKRGSDLGSFLKQAQRYANKKFAFDGVEIDRFPVLIYPPISGEVLEYHDPHRGGFSHDPNHEHHNVNGMIGKLCGVGEIRKFNEGQGEYIRFVFRNSTLFRTWPGSFKGAERLSPLKNNYEKALKMLNKEFPISQP